jgi:hypothetical protein
VGEARVGKEQGDRGSAVGGFAGSLTDQFADPRQIVGDVVLGPGAGDLPALHGDGGDAAVQPGESEGGESPGKGLAHRGGRGSYFQEGHVGLG